MKILKLTYNKMINKFILYMNNLKNKLKVQYKAYNRSNFIK